MINNNYQQQTLGEPTIWQVFLSPKLCRNSFG